MGLSKLLETLLSTKLWKSIVRLKLRLWDYPRFPIEKYFLLREIVKKNPDEIYCFVGVDNCSVSTWLQRRMFKYYWGHTGFVEIDEEGELSISHVRYIGLLKWKLLKYLKECDEFALLRLRLTHDEKIIVKNKLNKVSKGKVRYKLRDNLHLLAQYNDPNYWYHYDKFEFYCSEYQYFICQDLMSKIWSSGKARFTPDDLYKGSEVVWEYRSRKRKKNCNKKAVEK